MRIPASTLKLPLQTRLSSKSALWVATTLGFASIPLKLMSFNKAFEINGFKAEDKKLLMTQEWARQLVSSGLWMGSLVGSWALSNRLFPKQKALFHLLSANALSTVVDILARPFATAKLTRWMLSDTLDKKPDTKVVVETQSQPSEPAKPSSSAKSYAGKAFTGYDGNWQYNYWA